MLRRHASAALAVLVAAAACSPGEDGGAATCKGNFLPGDLVISEFFADPSGDDSGKEWIEIYNAGTSAVDLTGLELITSKSDGTGEKASKLPAMTLAAGGYLVAGDTAPDLLLPYVDVGYGNSLGALRNSDGRLALRCGSVIVDETTYATLPSGGGVSRGFTGALPPDGEANDDDAMWCAGTSVFADGKGTPGAANDPCKPVGQPTDCVDGTTTRPLVPPTAGDLVITEWMPNPKAVDDTLGEWFEVLVTRDVDLNGVTLGTAPPTVRETLGKDTKCLRKTAGSRILLARSDVPAMNGTLPAVDFTFGFTMTNTNGSLFVGIGTTVLDQVSYATSGDGVSTGMDPTKTDPADNELPANLCAGTMVFGAGDKGSPGMPNPSCGMMMSEGKCNDGGTMRDLVPPKVGDLVITEVMPNPAKVNDAVGEWFEVLVKADVDLNGLQIGPDATSVRNTLTSADCLKATTGSFLVFARSNDSTMNGGLPTVSYTFSFDLANTDMKSVALMRGGTLLDLATYPTATPFPTAGGVAASLPPTKQNTTDNDTAASFCPAVDFYVANDTTKDKGTPGRANPSCP